MLTFRRYSCPTTRVWAVKTASSVHSVQYAAAFCDSASYSCIAFTSLSCAGYGTLALMITVLFSFSPVYFWWSVILSATFVIGLGIGIALRPPAAFDNERAGGNVVVADIFGTLAIFLVAVAFAGRNLDLQLRRSFMDEYKLRAESDLITAEQERSTTLLNSMLPASIQKKLRRAQASGKTTLADDYDGVTVLFCEIYHFAAWCADKKPEEVVRVLNTVYSTFDGLLDSFQDGAVHKVETVGEVYMLVSGAPKRTLRHAEHAANMALAMVASMPDIRDSISLELGLDASDLHVRVGLNSGSIMAGVTGLTQPRFKLFGDTVNTASRMESTSLPDRIQTTPYTAQLLRESLTPFKLSARGGVEVKGKGTIETFWLFGRGRILPTAASEAVSAVHTLSEADFTEIGSNERSPLSANSSTAAQNATQHAIEQMIAESDAVFGDAPRLTTVGMSTNTPTNGLLGPRAASANSTWSTMSRPEGGSDSRLAELPAIMLAAPSLQDMSAAAADGGTPRNEGGRPATHVGVVDRPGAPEAGNTTEVELKRGPEARGIKLLRSASERNTSERNSSEHRTAGFSPTSAGVPFDFSLNLKVTTTATQRPPRPEGRSGAAVSAKATSASQPAEAIPVSYRTHPRDTSGLAAVPELDLDILTQANQGTGALTQLVVAAKMFSPRVAASSARGGAASPTAAGMSRRASGASAAATADSARDFDDVASVEYKGSSARSEAAQALLAELGVRSSAQSSSFGQSTAVSTVSSGRSALPPIQHSARGEGLAKDGFVADISSDAREARFEASLRAELAGGARTGRTDGGVFNGTSRSTGGASATSFSPRSARSELDTGDVEEYLAELNPEHTVGGWGARRDSTNMSEDTAGGTGRQSSDTALRPAQAVSPPTDAVVLRMQQMAAEVRTVEGTPIGADDVTASASVVAPDVSAHKPVGSWRVHGAAESKEDSSTMSPTADLAGLAAAASASWAEQDLDDDELSVPESPAALPSSVPHPGSAGAHPSPDTDAASTSSSTSSVLGKTKVHPIPPRHVVLSVPLESKAAAAGSAPAKPKRSSQILKQQSRSTTALVHANARSRGNTAGHAVSLSNPRSAPGTAAGARGLAKLRKVAKGASAAKTLQSKGAERRDPCGQFSQLCLYRAPKGANRAAHVVETVFVQEQSKVWRRFARMSSVGALVASVLFLLYDGIRLLSEDDEFRREIWPKVAIVRYGVLMPVLLIYLAFTFTRGFRKDHDVAQWSTGATLLLLGGCIIAINILGRTPGYGVLALFIVYSLNISLLAYLWRVLIFSALVVAYIVTVSFSGSVVDITIDTIKVSTDFIYLLVFFFGQALPVFAAEFHLRHNFLRRIQLRRARSALHKEQERSSQLLSNLLPPTIVSQLKAGRELIADFYPEATVLFTDLRGFTAFSSTVTPAQLVAFLNVLFSTFDRISTKFGVHKVELIGDAYFGVTGVPGAAADQSERAANMGLEMLMHMPAMRSVAGSDIKMRVGLHTGPVIAGVVGRKDPRYHLFGETVDVAMGMESSGIPDRIQVSQAAYERLMRRQYLRTIRYLRTLAVIAEIRAYAAGRLQEHASTASPANSSDAVQLVESAVTRNRDVLSADDSAPQRAPALVIGESMHGDSVTMTSPPLLSSPVPGLDLADGRIRARSSHALEESEDYSSVLKAAGGYFRKGSEELRVPTRSNLPIAPPDIVLDLPRDLLAWMYFAQPLTHDERTLSPVTDGQATIKQGAHTDITQVWSQKTGNFLGFDVEGSSVLTCPTHPLLSHTLDDGDRAESVLHTIGRNTLPSLEAPSPETALASAGTMATGKTIRPKRDRYDDPSWLIASKAEGASSVAHVGDLLGGRLDAASLVATTRMEVREEIAYSAAASSKTAHSLTPPITAHLALVAGLKDFEDPSPFLQQTFFGSGGGFFAFAYRGTQTIKGVGDEHTYMLTRALPCGLGDSKPPSSGD